MSPSTMRTVPFQLAAFGLAFLVTHVVLPATSHAQLVDAIRNFFRDPLIHAIDKGLKPDGDLAWELSELEEVTLETEAQAQAVLRALTSLSREHEASTESYNSVEYEVTNLFFHAYDNDSPAHFMLWRHGIPELISLYDKLRLRQEQATQAGQPVDEERVDDLIMMLAVMARYQTREGTDCVLEAAQSGYGESCYYWYTVFSHYSLDHPHAERLFWELRKKLPTGNIAAQLLSVANSIALENEDFVHPFSTPVGLLRLKQWLSSEVSDADQGYGTEDPAYDAAIALAFVDVAEREIVLEIAARHSSTSVRLEAAWAAAHAGLESGFERLVEYARDVHTSALAQAYLEEFERSDLIPVEALEPKFAAMAEFSKWLQDEFELARVPDELEVLDQRELKWLSSEYNLRDYSYTNDFNSISNNDPSTDPGTDEPILLSVVRYRAAGSTPLDDDETGVGLVGSMTWSFYSDDIEQLPVEDIYGVHYTFEAITYGLIEERDWDELVLRNPELAESVPKQWTAEPPLKDLVVHEVYRLDEELGYPQSQAYVASARNADKPGFVVLSGPDSRWYPADQFPEEVASGTILQLHIGRHLLGFPPAEARTLRPIPASQLVPEKVVEIYQAWLGELPTANEERRLELLGGYEETLALHFDKYVAAQAKLMGQTSEAIYVETYQLMLAEAQRGNAAQLDETLDAFAPVGRKFEGYATIIGQEHPEHVGELLKLFETRWVHNYGRSVLGRVAFKAGLRDEAKRILELQLADAPENVYQGEDSRILAEIWNTDGQADKARELLADSIRRCQVELNDTDYEAYKDDLRADIAGHQEVYQKLFGQPYMVPENP